MPSAGPGAAVADDGPKPDALHVFALALQSFTVMFVYGLSRVVMPLYLVSLGFSLASTGLLIAVGGVGSMAASLVTGAAIERADRRGVLAWSAAFLGALYACYIFTTTPGSISALRLVHGAATPIVSVASMMLFNDIGGKRSGRVAGVVNQWGSVGLVVGPLAGGTALQLAGPRGAFLLAAAVVLAGAAVVFFLLPRQTGRGEPQTRRRARLPFRPDRRFCLVLGVNVLDYVAFQVWMFLLPVHLKADGAPETLIGMLVTLHSLAYALLQSYCGRLADAGKGMRFVAAGACACGALVCLIPVVQAAWALAAVAIALGVALAPTYSGIFVEASRGGGEDGRARALGMLSASSAFGGTAGVALAGVLGGLSMAVGFGATLAMYWALAVLAGLHAATSGEARPRAGKPDGTPPPPAS